MGEIRNSYQIFVGKPEGKGPLRGPMCTWEDNIEMYFIKKLGYAVALCYKSGGRRFDSR